MADLFSTDEMTFFKSFFCSQLSAGSIDVGAQFSPYCSRYASVLQSVPELLSSLPGSGSETLFFNLVQRDEINVTEHALKESRKLVQMLSVVVYSEYERIFEGYPSAGLLGIPSAGFNEFLQRISPVDGHDL